MKPQDQETWAVVLAGGSGHRFGGPKQFQMLGGKRLIDHSLDAARATCDGVVLVVPGGVWHGDSVDVVTAGGTSHFESACRGVEATPLTADAILIVTVSHPLASVDLFNRVLGALAPELDAVMPAAPLPDALKSVESHQVVHSVDKVALVAAQTPSVFRASTLRSALTEAQAAGTEAPEELELIERVGGAIGVVEGEPTNLHITTPQDLRMAEAILPLVTPAPQYPVPNEAGQSEQSAQ